MRGHHRKKQAIIYLTTFSKLIRNQISNAQKEISLYEEIETCRLYTQLESLRFGSHITYEFKTDETIDMHSLMIPPLILQPFIENAIWHGVLPKGKGNVTVSVTRGDNAVICSIEDDGIGREMALRNKPQNLSTYESKGMKLVKNRLSLYNNIHNNCCSVDVEDKKDEANNAAGTLVIITFKYEA